MKKLVSSSQAAQILGLSLQGIHYRIKKGQLESIKRDGKIFVYVDSKTTTKNPKQVHIQSDEQLIQVKDEQIELLKKTIKFVKKQKDREIQRLEKQQNKIMDVFQSEVDLLKSAFNEMRAIYKIEHNTESTSTISTEQSSKKTPRSSQLEFMDIKEFFIFMKEHNKTDSQIKNIILNKIKHGDKRFIYNKETKEVIIYKSDFLDLI
ncbi:MAG: DNA-binding protein [Campylobacterota bacterium]|nr:DNA-binding protein [Campylobacterota bacterium]